MGCQLEWAAPIEGVMCSTENQTINLVDQMDGFGKCLQGEKVQFRSSVGVQCSLLARLGLTLRVSQGCLSRVHPIQGMGPLVSYAGEADSGTGQPQHTGQPYSLRV